MECTMHIRMYMYITHTHTHTQRYYYLCRAGMCLSGYWPQAIIVCRKTRVTHTYVAMCVYTYTRMSYTLVRCENSRRHGYESLPWQQALLLNHPTRLYTHA